MSLLARILTPKQLRAVTVPEYDPALLATGEPHVEKPVKSIGAICPICGGERTLRPFLKGPKICESKKACLEALVASAVVSSYALGDALFPKLENDR